MGKQFQILIITNIQIEKKLYSSNNQDNTNP